MKQTVKIWFRFLTVLIMWLWSSLIGLSILVSHFILIFLDKIRQAQVFSFSQLSCKLQQHGQFLRLRFSTGFSQRCLCNTCLGLRYLKYPYYILFAMHYPKLKHRQDWQWTKCNTSFNCTNAIRCEAATMANFNIQKLRSGNVLFPVQNGTEHNRTRTKQVLK